MVLAVLGLLTVRDASIMFHLNRHDEWKSL